MRGRLVYLVGEWGPPPTARGGPSLASPNKAPLAADAKLVPFVRRWGPRGDPPPTARNPPTKSTSLAARQETSRVRGT